MKDRFSFVIALSLLATSSFGQLWLDNKEATRKSMSLSPEVFSDFTILGTSAEHKSEFEDFGRGHYSPGFRAPTRFEGAVLIHAVISSAKTAFADSRRSKAELVKRRELISIQIELLREFSKELKDLGVDVGKTINDLLVSSGKVLPSESEIDTTPGANWIADDIDALRRSGYLSGYYDGHRPKRQSGYELAVAAHATYAHLLDAEQKARDTLSSGKARIDRQVGAAPLARLIDRFATELYALGIENPRAIFHEVTAWETEKTYADDKYWVATVPRNAAIYEDLLLLKKAGILVGLHTHGGMPTRYEAAIATHATYVRIESIIEHKGSSEADLKAAFESIAPLHRLTSSFEKELASLGVPIDRMQQELARMSFTRALRLPSAPSGFSVEILDNSTSNAWIYRDIGALRSAGFLVGYPDGLHYQADWSRLSNYEAALAAYVASDNAKTMLALMKEARLQEDFNRVMQATSWSPRLAEIERLSKRFGKELLRLGADPDAIHTEIRKGRELIGDFWRPENVLKWNLEKPPASLVPQLR